MNFLKNSLNKLFAKGEEEATEKEGKDTKEEVKEKQEELDIPEEALTEMFKMTAFFISLSKVDSPD